MPLAPFDSQKFLPWPEAVTYTSVRAAGNVSTAVARAGVYRKAAREAAPSYGVVVGANLTVTIGRDELPGEPKPRDYVTRGGRNYTVQGFEGGDYLRFWKVFALNLSLANDLKVPGKLLRPTNTPDAAGKRVPGLTVLASVYCRVQPITAAPDAEFEARVMGERSRAFLDVFTFPRADDVFESAGVRYTVVGWGDVELIGSVPYLDLERRE